MIKDFLEIYSYNQLISVIYSHYSMIFSVFAGLATMIVVTFLKRPFKRINYRIAENDENPEGVDLRYHRMNLGIMLLTEALAALIFGFMTVFVDRLTFSIGGAALAGCYALGIYEVIEQTSICWKRFFYFLFLLVFIIAIDFIYGKTIGPHFKLCYSFKIAAVVMTIAGVIHQLSWGHNKKTEQE